MVRFRNSWILAPPERYRRVDGARAPSANDKFDCGGGPAIPACFEQRDIGKHEEPGSRCGADGRVHAVCRRSSLTRTGKRRIHIHYNLSKTWTARQTWPLVARLRSSEAAVSVSTFIHDLHRGIRGDA